MLPANVYRAQARPRLNPLPRQGDKTMTGLPKGPVTVREFEEIDLKSAMLIEAFPTIRLVSTIAASYLASQLQLNLAAAIPAPLIPPVAVVYSDRPRLPA